MITVFQVQQRHGGKVAALGSFSIKLGLHLLGKQKFHLQVTCKLALMWAELAGGSVVIESMMWRWTLDKVRDHESPRGAHRQLGDCVLRGGGKLKACKLPMTPLGGIWFGLQWCGVSAFRLFGRQFSVSDFNWTAVDWRVV